MGCSPTSRDVILLVDISGSMTDMHTAEATRLDAVRDASRAMLSDLAANDQSTQVGVVTFVAGAELWSPLTNINTDAALAAVDEQLTTLDWCDRSYSPWESFSGGAYYHDAPQMQGCDSVRTDDPEMSPSDAGTAHDEALQLAISELLAAKEPGRSSEIVLFTDSPALCVPTYEECEEERQADAEAVVESVRFKDIVINVVHLNNPDLPAEGAEQLCALATPAYDSDCLAENPFFFSIPSGDEDALMSAIEDIADGS